MQPKRPHQIAVIGGGVAGLAAAYYLRRDGGDLAQVTIFEAAPRVGGKLRLGEVAGLGVDEGAESLLTRRPEAVDLIKDVGLGDQITHPVTTSAGIWSRGALHQLPAAQVMGVPVELAALAGTGLLSRGGLARVPLDRVLPRTRLSSDVPVGRYVAARLGREVVDRLVEPLLGGVYAGRADELSFAATMPELADAASQHRSLLAAARRVRAGGGPTTTAVGPVFAGLPGGVGRLPAAIAAGAGATVRTGATVRELRRTPGGWRLLVDATTDPGSADRQWVEADAVVLATPAGPASRLLGIELPGIAAELATIDYASVAVVTLAYPRAAMPALPGSGFLVPPVERRAAKGVTFSSAKWGWVAAADPGTVLVRVSVGRYGEEQDLQRDDAELGRLAAAELAALVGVRATPIDMLVSRWGGALPQYRVGHRNRVARIKSGVTRHRGLAVCGAAYDGVGVAACIGSAKAAAAGILAGLGQAAGAEPPAEPTAEPTAEPPAEPPAEPRTEPRTEPWADAASVG
ncbi:MAG: protoporphyrinogen oxidase [Sporichthyaceae bacterium]|nr:protoporphyrinogen oxidase [Sporichthyaceae bacterium]